MLTLKLIAMIVGVPILGFLLYALFAAIAFYAFRLPVESPWEKSHLESPRAEKIRTKIIFSSLILGLLVSSFFLYVVLFTEFSVSNWLTTVRPRLSIEVSPFVATVAGIVAGLLWAIQLERDWAQAEGYARSTAMSVEEKFDATRNLRRNTLLAMALVLSALLLTLFLPLGEESFFLALALVGVSTIFVERRRIAY